jgi:hypothetical protein
VSAPLNQRLVATLLGGAVLWRVVNGVGAVVRWLWLGNRLGDTPMALFLVSVVVAPIVGAVGGDIAVRRGIWPKTAGAHARRRETVVGVVVLPVLGNALLGWLLAGRAGALPLHGLTTLALVTLLLLVEQRVGPLLGGDE